MAIAATRKQASERHRWTVRAVPWQKRMEARVVQSGTNLALQLSSADQAHGMNIDTVWNILGPVRVDLNPGLKQSVASGFGDEADQEACKVSVPVLNLCQRARPPGPSKAILEFHLKL